MSNFTALLPASLLTRAFVCGGEFAWSRSDVLDVISLAERAGCAVLGVDIWIPSHRGPIIPTPFVYDWSSDDQKDSPQVPKSATEFVQTFKWDATDEDFKNREPYFNLTVADKPN
jgi:hypothetical protein